MLIQINSLHISNMGRNPWSDEWQVIIAVKQSHGYLIFALEECRKYKHKTPEEIDEQGSYTTHSNTVGDINNKSLLVQNNEDQD